MTDLRYDTRDNSICWSTSNSGEFIQLLPNEDGGAMIGTIKAFAALPLKADAINVPFHGGKTVPVKGWRLGTSDIILVKLPGGYSITHRPTGVQIIAGLYKTRAYALDQLPRVVIALSRARDTIANWQTLNY